MQHFLLLLILPIILTSCGPAGNETNDNSGNQNSFDSSNYREVKDTNAHIESHQDFELDYVVAGMGSNIGLQPVFRVRGTNYTYSMEPNSFYGRKDIAGDTISKGRLRSTSIDSILSIVSVLEDTVIKRINTGTMSGGIHFIGVSSDSTSLSFELQNAYDSTADKIIQILNSNIPHEFPDLWIFQLETNN